MRSDAHDMPQIISDGSAVTGSIFDGDKKLAPPPPPPPPPSLATNDDDGAVDDEAQDDDELAWWRPLAAVINPEVHAVSEEMESSYEACLSLPGWQGLVPRHLAIDVCFDTLDPVLVDDPAGVKSPAATTTTTAAGGVGVGVGGGGGDPPAMWRLRRVSTRLEGYAARVFQHEYDHLEGLMYTDRVECESHVERDPDFEGGQGAPDSKVKLPSWLPKIEIVD